MGSHACCLLCPYVSRSWHVCLTPRHISRKPWERGVPSEATKKALPQKNSPTIVWTREQRNGRPLVSSVLDNAGAEGLLCEPRRFFFFFFFPEANVAPTGFCAGSWRMDRKHAAGRAPCALCLTCRNQFKEDALFLFAALYSTCNLCCQSCLTCTRARYRCDSCWQLS